MKTVLMSLLLLVLVSGFVFSDESAIYVNIYTIGSTSVIANIINTEISTEAQLNEAIITINKDFRDHVKFGGTPFWEALEHIAYDAELFSEMSQYSQYLLIVSDFLPNSTKVNLLKTEEARNLSRRPEELQGFIIDKLNRKKMHIFPVSVKGRQNISDQNLARSLSSDGNVYNLDETHLNYLLEQVKVDIDREIPVVLHILLDHSESLQSTVRLISKNLTNSLQEIWRHYQVSKTPSPLEGFLRNSFIDMPEGSYEIGTENGHPIEAFHTIRLSSYKIMTSPVMQKLYNLYLTENNNLNNPAKNKNDELPQTNISYSDACRFIEFLNNFFNTSGFFIPKEEQLEALYKTRPGDLSYGNVLELSSSFFGDYNLSQIIDPEGPMYGTDISVRGYPMESDSSRIRPATRGRIDPNTPSPLVGFRLAYRGGN